MHPFRDLPLKRKLMVVVMLTSTVAMLLGGTASVTYELARDRRNMTRDLTTLAEMIGANTAAALAFHNAPAAGNTLAVLRSQPEITHACLYATDGRLVAEYRAPNSALEPMPDPPRRRHWYDRGDLVVCQPIQLGSQTVGRICLRMDMRHERVRLLSYALIAVAVALASLVLALFLSHRLQQTIADPVLELARAARALAAQPESSLRVTRQSHDEIGELTTAFNQMLAQIQQRDAALLRRSEELQVQLLERTRAQVALAERVRLAAFQGDVAVALNRGDPLPETLTRCAASVVRHLDAAFARIWTLNERDNLLELQASAGLYTHCDGPHGRIPVGGRLKIGIIAQQRQPLLTNSVVGDPHVDNQDWAKREGMVAFAGYPLLVEDRLVGVLAMFARQPLTEATLQAMASIAHALALGIDSRRKAEALRAHEARLDGIITSAMDAIINVDADQKIVLFNAAAEQMFGCPAAGAIGQPLARFIPERFREVHQEQVRHYGQTGATARRMGELGAVTGLRADGREFPAEASISRTDVAGQKQFTVILRDVSERRKLEREILEVSDREQQRIGQDLHDGLCQHLTATLLAAKVLEEKLAESAVPEAADAQQISRYISRAISQTRDIAHGLDPVIHDPDGLMVALRELAAGIEQTSQIPCRFDCEPPVLVTDSLAAGHLYRIAQEALTNAVKHARPAQITVRLAATADQIALTIEDDGIGLPAGQRLRHGMGLRTMEYRAAVIGAQLDLQRRSPRGTAVRCALPR